MKFHSILLSRIPYTSHVRTTQHRKTAVGNMQSAATPHIDLIVLWANYVERVSGAKVWVQKNDEPLHKSMPQFCAQIGVSGFVGN
mgnify:CR=1 FL=1